MNKWQEGMARRKEGREGRHDKGEGRVRRKGGQEGSDGKKEGRKGKKGGRARRNK